MQVHSRDKVLIILITFLTLSSVAFADPIAQGMDKMGMDSIQIEQFTNNCCAPILSQSQIPATCYQAISDIFNSPAPLPKAGEQVPLQYNPKIAPHQMIGGVGNEICQNNPIIR